MAIKIYNTLSKNLEEFIPISKDKVSLYTCGPTVYNYPHIGNYRAYIFGDILKRHLLYSGYNVNHVMNITDIDDKTIRDSIKEGKTLSDFTEFYTEEFYKDRDMLNMIPADKYTKATSYVKEMLLMVESLIDKGYAYTEADGSAYFDISKDLKYGKLSHFKLDELKDNAKGRIKKDEYEKENAQDFALWKAWDENDGDVFWLPSVILGRESPLAKGRPGWHIECSAMSIANLGETIDIHTGGVDNMFPHHENEIAQSECSTGKEFVHYWMHNEHLMVDGKKMAKSAGNFYTLRDIMNMGIDPIAFRYWLYTGHYKTKVNFTKESLHASAVALARLYEAYQNLGEETGEVNESYKTRFTEYMDNDLNTPQALALVWELLKDKNVEDKDKKMTLLDFDQIFGFKIKDQIQNNNVIPENILALVEDRRKAKKENDWIQSDKIREEILSLGYELRDTGDETIIKKIH